MLSGSKLPLLQKKNMIYKILFGGKFGTNLHYKFMFREFCFQKGKFLLEYILKTSGDIWIHLVLSRWGVLNFFFLTGCVARGLKPLSISKDFLPQKKGLT